MVNSSGRADAGRTEDAPSPRSAPRDPLRILTSIGAVVYDWDFGSDEIVWGSNAERNAEAEQKLKAHGRRVLTHAGEDGGDRPAAVHLRGGAEQHVDRGAAEVLLRALVQPHPHTAGDRRQPEVEVTRREQGLAGPRDVAVDRLAHGER